MNGRGRQFWNGLRSFFSDAWECLPSASLSGYIVGMIIAVAGMCVIFVSIILTAADSPRNYPYSGQIVWEKYDGGVEANVYRIRAAQGWIVRSGDRLIYVPDPENSWVIQSPTKGN